MAFGILLYTKSRANLHTCVLKFKNQILLLIGVKEVGIYYRKFWYISIFLKKDSNNLYSQNHTQTLKPYTNTKTIHKH